MKKYSMEFVLTDSHLQLKVNEKVDSQWPLDRSKNGPVDGSPQQRFTDLIYDFAARNNGPIIIEIKG